MKLIEHNTVCCVKLVLNGTRQCDANDNAKAQEIWDLVSFGGVWLFDWQLRSERRQTCVVPSSVCAFALDAWDWDGYVGLNDSEIR